MDLTKIELQPCPFCGSAQINLTASRRNAYISCRSCGAFGPHKRGWSKLEPVNRWNARALTTATATAEAQARIADLERQLAEVRAQLAETEKARSHACINVKWTQGE